MFKLAIFILTLLITVACGNSEPPADQNSAVQKPAASPGAEVQQSANTVQAPGKGSVTIYRDDWGVPHIYAQTQEDGFYGLAYAQAEDQLSLLLYMVASIQSKSASINGAAAVPTDLRSLIWRHVEKAKEGFPRLNQQLQRNYIAYTAGLEQYLADHPDQRPAWLTTLEPWTWVAMSRFSLWPYDIKDGLGDCAAAGVRAVAAVDRPLDAYDPVGIRWASNEWLIHPWRTADNAMIVLSDPHGGIDGAGFYEFGMEAGGLKTAGYTMGPLMILTHNSDVSWGMTTGAPDVSDCFVVDVDPASPRRYQFDGEWQDMIVKDITIEVKDGEPVNQTIEYTMHNGVLSPVVARDGNKAYVVSSAYMDEPELFDEVIYRMNLAKNVDEVRQANTLLGMFPQNVMVGDRHGNSYYIRAGRAPRRPAGFDYTKPVPGNSSASAWQGLHPAEDLVQVSDPDSGYMQNCNVPPEEMIAENNPIVASNYPDYIYYSTAALSYTMRGRRAKEVLSSALAFTIEDAKAFAVDEKWFGTEQWQAALDAAAVDQVEAISGWQPNYRKTLDRLLKFDGYARKESVAALAWFHWRTQLNQKLDAEQKAALNEVLTGRQTLSKELAQQLTGKLTEAVDEMEKVYGTVDRAYGEVFRIGRDYANSWPVGGGVGVEIDGNFGLCPRTAVNDLPCPLTMRAFAFAPADEQGHRLASGGSRALRLVAFTEPLQSWSLHNYGQSTNPDSPHYDDQARELVSNGQLKSMYFNTAELEQHVESSKTLTVPEM